MKKLLDAFIKLGLLAVVVCALLAMLALYYLRTPVTLAAETHVIIPKGTRSLGVAMQLADAGIIRYPYAFYATQVATGNARKFKAGEYAFEANATPGQVAQKLVSGEVVIHKVTIPEGWNIREIKAVLAADTVLTGDITIPMPEGSLMPETYYYTYGDTRDAIIRRMQIAMTKALDEAWATRAEGLPLATKEEALILASIVEKETGVPEERTRVAAVFINRLRKGMMLQTDPTVIYGIEQLSGKPMERPLNYADLQTPSNYNTYRIVGLPPTPIANPSVESIEAALHPLQTDEIYFVATGNGGHNFAATLEEHNQNVIAYRRTLQTQKDE